MPRRSRNKKPTSPLDKYIVFRDKETNEIAIDYVYRSQLPGQPDLSDVPNPFPTFNPLLIDRYVHFRNDAVRIIRYRFLNLDEHYDQIQFVDTLPELTLKLLLRFIQIDRSWKLGREAWFEGTTQRQRSKMLQALCTAGLMTKMGRTSNSRFLTTPAGRLLIDSYMDAEPPEWAGLPPPQW